MLTLATERKIAYLGFLSIKKSVVTIKIRLHISLKVIMSIVEKVVDTFKGLIQRIKKQKLISCL